MNKIFQVSRTFLTLENEMFEVHKIFPTTAKINIEDWKKFLNADKVFRKDDNLYFCSLIEEATIIQEDENK